MKLWQMQIIRLLGEFHHQPHKRLNTQRFQLSENPLTLATGKERLGSPHLTKWFKPSTKTMMKPKPKTHC